jgi:Fe-S-cluster containining protein
LYVFEWRRANLNILQNKEYVMRCSHCGVCCTETEMLLSKRDIKRLQKQGYSPDYFVQYDKQGYAQLKNRDGYCVFYDRKNGRCRVYPSRPSGCRVYPVIFDEECGIVLDSICPSRSTITQEQKALKGKQVVRLLERIDLEAMQRRTSSC